MSEQIARTACSHSFKLTHEYGVSFERGTAVDFRNADKLLFRVMASINNHGGNSFSGDVVRQAERMCENVEAIIKRAPIHALKNLQYIILFTHI